MFIHHLLKMSIKTDTSHFWKPLYFYSLISDSSLFPEQWNTASDHDETEHETHEIHNLFSLYIISHIPIFIQSSLYESSPSLPIASSRY